MKRRLLLDVEVIAYLERLPPRERTAIWKRLREIALQPDRFLDYRERDECGRDLPVHFSHRHAILFWDDFADRHIKVLEISNADDFVER